MSDTNLRDLDLEEFTQYLSQSGISGPLKLREDKINYWIKSTVMILADFFVPKYSELEKEIDRLNNRLVNKLDNPNDISKEDQYNEQLAIVSKKFYKLIQSEPSYSEMETLRLFNRENEDFQTGFMISYLGEKASLIFPEFNASTTEFYRGLAAGALYKSPFSPHRTDSIVEELLNRKKNLDDIVVQSSEESERLRKLYEEKLRLSLPADYWGRLKISYKWQAIIWFCIAILILIAASSGGFILLTNIDRIFTRPDDSLSVIKSSIMLSVLISLVYYAIHQTFKLSFSAFHLERDATERELLTYLYLTLKNDKAVEEADRIIILQSLFSRADTGLIKGDSHPTMPLSITNLLSKLGSGK